MALLRHIAGDTSGHWGYEQLAPYIAAARQSVESKNAFSDSSDTLSVEGYVLRGERLDWPDKGLDRDKARNRAIRQIINATEGETVTADAWDLFTFVNIAIAEAQLYGAAVMFELLERTRR